MELESAAAPAHLAEADIGHVQQDQTVQFSVEAFPEESFSGTVKYIDPTVRSTTRDLVVEAVVPNPEHRLRPGMFATARLDLPDQALVSVPKSALRTRARPPISSRWSMGTSRSASSRPARSATGGWPSSTASSAGDVVVSKLDAAVKDGVPVK